MGQVTITTGNYSAAEAARFARVQVVAAYPITPQTTIVERLAKIIEDGQLKAKYVRVESEHSAMAACIGACAAGARVFTATSSHGLLYMHEMLHWTSIMRLPVVMCVVNRALGPWNIHVDHNDSISQRDTGWIQFYVEDNQEIFDTVIQSYRISEETLLPSMICLDGFILSHTAQPLELPAQADVDEFIPHDSKKHLLLDIDNPMTLGSLNMDEPGDEGTPSYMENRYLAHKSMNSVREALSRVDGEFKRKFGRSHGGLIEEYRCSDAEIVMVSMGTLAAQARAVVDEMREDGHKVGAAKLRVFRPFPSVELRDLAERVKAFVILDRNISYGSGGAVFTEARSALYGMGRQPLVLGYVAGLGGRDITPDHQKAMFEEAAKALEKGETEREEKWFNLKRGVQ
ncbi:MAG: pyruvate ferredoxin oxidoreductase [Promethearchaeati archaeon SRVP18_Atabeyarchaeia-1]